MGKRALLILSAIAILLFIIGLVVFGGSAGAAAAQCAQYQSDQTAYQQCVTQAGSGMAGGALIGILLYAVGALLSLIAWIGGMIKTARLGRWGWFVVILLFTPLATLLYGLFGNDKPAGQG